VGRIDEIRERVTVWQNVTGGGASLIDDRAYLLSLVERAVPFANRMRDTAWDDGEEERAIQWLQEVRGE
jgi:hypothetical protein